MLKLGSCQSVKTYYFLIKAASFNLLDYERVHAMKARLLKATDSLDIMGETGILLKKGRKKHVFQN